ncbi:MAG: hypothetical protein HRU12_06805 [Phaeodactylibacter sp.]|nr:hypothetical protein [Phaeodactylibacter sp.]
MKFNGIGMLTNRRHGCKEALYEVTVMDRQHWWSISTAGNHYSGLRSDALESSGIDDK